MRLSVLFFFLSILSVTESTTSQQSDDLETVDDLRRMWMLEEQARMELANEILTLEAGIRSGNVISQSLIALSVDLGPATESANKVLQSIKEVKKANPDLKIEALIEEAKREIAARKSKLETDELEMEDLWNKPEFKLALDTILEQKLLTPSPNAPNPYNNDIWQKALKNREEFFKEEETKLKSIRAEMADVTKHVKKIFHKLSKSKIFSSLLRQFTLLHRQIDTFSRKNQSSESMKAISFIKNRIDEFEKNQEKEFELESKLNMKIGIERLENIWNESDQREKPINELTLKRLGNDQFLSNDTTFQVDFDAVKKELKLDDKKASKTATPDWCKNIPEKFRKYMTLKIAYDGISKLLKEHGTVLEEKIAKISKTPLEIVEIYKRIAFDTIRRIKHDEPKIVRTFFGNALHNLLFSEKTEVKKTQS